jgi:hypothetical protein
MVKLELCALPLPFLKYPDINLEWSGRNSISKDSNSVPFGMIYQFSGRKFKRIVIRENLKTFHYLMNFLIYISV